MKRFYISLLTVFITTIVFAENNPKEKSYKVRENSGIEFMNGVYQISTAEGFVQFAKNVNSGEVSANAILTADIDMSGYCLDVICPDGSGSYYSGTFDGQGHKICNLKIESTSNYTGIFGIVGPGAHIQNFVLDKTCSIIGGSQTGIIGGTATVEGEVYITAIGNEGCVRGVRNVGAIFGCNEKMTATVYIDRCYSTGTIVGDLESGALTGYIRNGYIHNSWSSASITGYYTNSHKPFALCYCDTKNNYVVHTDLNPDYDIKGITHAQVSSGELCYLLNQNSDEGSPIWFQTLGKDAHPVLDSTHGIVYNLGETYSNTMSSIAFVDGAYQITTAEGLVQFASIVNGGELDANAVLTADLDMGGKLVDGSPAEDSPLFIPIGSTEKPYQGTFDGQGHVIKNLVINRNENYVGMFGRITLKAVIKNFVIDSNSYIGGNAFVGVVGGTIDGNSTVLIDRIGMEGAVVASAQHAGGILGCNMNNPPTVLSNCYVTGPVKGARESGQINGWLGGGRIENCWAIGSIEGVYNGDAFYRGAPVAKNNYSNAPDRNDGVNEFNASDARSGKMTFMLNNGNIKNPTWYQTIGEDDLPTLNPTHKVVYANGHVSCGGEPIDYVTYTNTPIGMQQDEHNIVHGVCTVCGFVDVNYCQQDEDGYYQIDNAEDLVWFAYMANSGIKGLAGRLTSDINMSSVNDVFPMIGNNDCLFNSGKFDGQGHTISNLRINRPNEDHVGLFGYITGDCDIRNFVLDETCSIIGGAYTAIIGATASRPGTVNITAVGNEGYVKGGRNTGAIFGSELGAAATVNIDRCYSSGTVIGDLESGALTGYISKGYIYNSWSSASIEGYYDGTDGSVNKPFALCYCDTRNNYIVHTDLNPNFDIKGITHAQVSSGELCYLLNQNSDEGSLIWFQTLGMDDHPVLDSTHGVVVIDEDGNFINSPESIPIKGDVNRDGKISIVDVAALVEILQGRDNVEPYKYSHWAADVDEDGFITLADLTALRDIILER